MGGLVNGSQCGSRRGLVGVGGENQMSSGQPRFSVTVPSGSTQGAGMGGGRKTLEGIRMLVAMIVKGLREEGTMTKM